MNRLGMLILAATVAGCSASRHASSLPQFPSAGEVEATARGDALPTQPDVSSKSRYEGGRLRSGTDLDADQANVADREVVSAPSPLPPNSSPDPSDGPATAGLSLERVIGSVYQTYPLLEAAVYSRVIAEGEQLAAAGEFDLKLKAASENGPTGFYQTYRQTVGLIQPTYRGGEVFAGYRIGRGDFEPWYKERETNGGGEFKAGMAIPLARDRSIDPRRAELWRATYGRQIVEPEIQAELIGFVQEATYAYWEWVAAGARYRIAEELLELATERTERIRRQVEEGFLDPPELTDNLRLVAERRGKRADAERKLRQTAIKLSLYYRDLNGNPSIPEPERLPEFPNPGLLPADDVPRAIQSALQQRPEIAVLNLMQRQLDVDYAEFRNEFRPSIDAVLAGSQDVGEPTSPKNDKGQFELDASVFVDIPIQRRKSRGKMQAIEGKIAQVAAKRRLTEDKIVADVQAAQAALCSAFEQVREAEKAVTYAEDLAQRERRSFDLGVSDLLKVTLREQYAFESAEKTVEALLLYFQARADYRAAIAEDRLPSSSANP